MQEEIVRLLPIRRGHFRLESGHHGDLWIDLERLCLDPRPIQRLAREIAVRVALHKPEIICGPLVEGAFVALMVAAEMGLPFCYSERFEPSLTGSPSEKPEPLYPATYRVPGALRPEISGKRVAIVNDVINAGSAVRGTVADLAECGAQTAVIGSLVVLGSWASEYAAAEHLPLETLASVPNSIWAPSDCPLCRKGMSLVSGTS